MSANPSRKLRRAAIERAQDQPPTAPAPEEGEEREIILTERQQVLLQEGQNALMEAQRLLNGMMGMVLAGAGIASGKVKSWEGRRLVVVLDTKKKRRRKKEAP